MSQSVNADSGAVVTASQIEAMSSHPSYRFEPQFPNTFGQNIVLGSSQTPVTINIPPEVFNLAQSYLDYTVYLPQGQALTWTWLSQNALKEISHIQFYSGSNMWIVDLDNLQNYLDIVFKKELSQEEFLSEDPMTGIYANNSLVNVAPALRNSNNTTTNQPNLANNPSSVNYREPAYFTAASAISGALAVGSIAYNVQFPHRIFRR